MLDWVHRMMPNWDTFVEELQELSTDTRALEFLDGQVIQEALEKVKEGVKARNG